jgi:hypothetical protein
MRCVHGYLLMASTLLGLTLIGCSQGVVVDTQQVLAPRVSTALPREDPGSPLWSKASEHPARLMLQDITEPKLTEPGVELVHVRALHDGSWLVFRLEWEDKTMDLIPQPGLGSDAAAIQFSGQAGTDVPDAAMGEKGKGVRIWYWKALWQDDADRARLRKGDRVSALYPQGTTDHYPFEAGGAARTEMEKRYAPAQAAGNPVAVRAGAGPVQVLMAEGFGNVSPAKSQDGTGHGAWKDGKWLVTIARPLDMGPDMASLEAGKRTYMAFAVWDGAARNTGSRKMRSGWIPLLLEVQ